ncbi:hypothetical protein SUGI_0430120 [Cryptomeria japonica]|nr:hypothetical protein SUGI_0430120 [Cryptomeria japonica]
MSRNKITDYIICGDFNTISSLAEKSGGCSREPQSLVDFKDWTFQNNLTDIQTDNGVFTWTNRRSGFSMVAKRMDRFLVKDNSGFLNNILVKASILPFSGSDHFPIQLSLAEDLKLVKCPFKLELMWLKEDNFIDMLEKWWSSYKVSGSKLFCFVSKLKLIKQALLSWN